MLRLLQGDVGSGKTIVALLALLNAVEAGLQGALMAPTEILVRQHLAALEPYAKAAGVRLAALTGREQAPAASATLTALAAGEIDILIGTHALFSEDVAFRDLGLAVVDEQHRFGVHQRMSCRARAQARRCAGDDGDADPPHPGAHRLWRHGCLAHHRPPAGTQAGGDAGDERGAAGRTDRASEARALDARRSAPIGSARWWRNPKRSIWPPPRNAPRCCARRWARKSAWCMAG